MSHEPADPAAAPAPAHSAEEPGSTLMHRTLDAAQWQMAASLVQGLLRFGIGILLARLLPPEDFGLFTLAFVVVELATMVADLGLGPAVVQRKSLGERHVRVAFTTSVIGGLVIAALVYAAAPLLALLLRTPALTPVLRVEALLFLALGFGTVARALLQRGLDFRRLFWVELTSYGVGYALVAVTMGLMGFGVWSLVGGALAQAVLGSLLALVLARHSLRPLFAGAELRDLVGFGAGVSVIRIVNYFARHGDNVIVGRWLGPYFLGLYGRAYHLMTLPLGYLGAVTGSVLFPALAQIQHDRGRMERAFLRGVELTALVGAPVMMGLVVAAPHLMLGLFGPQWTGAVLPFQILAAVALFQVIYDAAGAVAQAAGEVYAEARRQAVYALLVIAGSLLGSRFGLAGVSIGVALSIVAMYLMMAQLTVRITEGSWRRFFAAQAPGLLLSLPVGAAALLVRSLLERQGVGSLWILLAIFLACAATLLLGVYLLPEAVRPRELFRSVDGMVARLPAALRAPLRQILRVTPENIQVPT